MTLIADASFLIAALTSQERDGDWARRTMRLEPMVSGHHLPMEVSNVLRRMELAGELAPDVAAIAHAELLATPVDLQPYAPLALRVWQLRHTVTIEDAWYVALAEFHEAPLATLDLRLTRAPGPRCRFLTPATQ